MAISTRQDVARVLALFTRNGDNVTSSHGLMVLAVELHARRAQGVDSRLADAVSILHAEHATLLTILERTEWQKQSARDGHLNDTLWFFFSTLDVEHYYIVLRSLFDHIAGVCAETTSRRDQIPRSFNKLLEWCADRSRADRILGADLTELLLSCDWFHDIRKTRDGIVHFGALTLAFPSAETIAFNVAAGDRSSAVPNELMINETIADCELFMAWTLGNLQLFLDSLARLILARIPDPRDLGVTAYQPGMRTLVRHLERLAERLPDRDA